MADYIERAAVEHMLEAAQIISDGEYCGYCTEDVRLSEIPAADVAPVRWISVDDRLPDDDLIERQVICAVRHQFCEPYVVALFWWGHLDSHWQDVTHWMPLPEPPEEKDEM